MHRAAMSRDDSPEVGSARSPLVTLVRLRWWAVLAQAGTIATASITLPVPLDLRLLAQCLGFTVATNLTLAALVRFTRITRGGATLVLAADTAVLTVMLAASGGAWNPFTSFYLLHIALAAVLLSQRNTMIIMALSLAGFALLYFEAIPTGGAGALAGLSDTLRLQGGFAALVLTGVAIAYFTGSLRHALRGSERELEVHRLRLEREQRFTSLATLAAGVAHELSTPLATVAVVSKEMENTACTQCLNGSCRDDARLIRREVDRCRAIIDRLGDDCLVDADGDGETIDVGALADELGAFLQAEHRERLRCTVAPKFAALAIPPLPPLFQSLASLVKNGCEADASGRAVEIAVDVAGEWLRFSVRDHGAGMEEPVAARVGEPFFTTKPPGQGTGLGLFIVRMFAERMQGGLDIRARDGGGTEVVLTIPHREQPGAHGHA
jgi:two-component system sensor histidine kinase RegB